MILKRIVTLLKLAADRGSFFMAKSKKITDALNRLAAAEERFLASEFLAPVVSGGQVQVRIAGVICSLKIQPADFAGWGVFRPVSHGEAKLVRQAKLAERQRYLELFPLVRLILVGQHENQWLAVPAHRGDSRFRIEGAVPVQLIEDAQPFEVIETRFDGAAVLVRRTRFAVEPGDAQYRGQEMGSWTPEQLRAPGLTAEERAAYAVTY